MSGSVIQIDSYRIWAYEVNLGFLLLGLLALIIGLFSLAVSKNWQAVTEAGRQYLNLRWIPIAVIEKLAQIEQIGLAGLENEWRFFSRQNPNVDFHPFKDVPELENLRLPSLQKTRSWASMLNVILFLQIIYYFIVVLGVLLIGIAFL